MTKWHDGENRTAEDDVLPRYRELVEPRMQLKPGELIVLSGDRAFHRQPYRRKLRDSRIVENIHLASHGDSETTIHNVDKLNRQRVELAGTKWWVNGHNERFCSCGEGLWERRFKESNGRARHWVEADCDTCGHLTLTPGQWRRVQNPGRFVPVTAHTKHLADWSLGAPLTFNSKLSNYYGTARFAYQEGAHGVLANGQALLRGKRWFREPEQVRLEAAMVYVTQHALGRWQRRAAAGAEQRRSAALAALSPASGTTPVAGPGALPEQAANGRRSRPPEQLKPTRELGGWRPAASGDSSGGRDGTGDEQASA